MKKKDYIKPKAETLTLETEQMIAASNESVVIEPTEIGDPSEADSRLMEIIGAPIFPQ